jgi:hypothetical protein
MGWGFHPRLGQALLALLRPQILLRFRVATSARISIEWQGEWSTSADTKSSKNLSKHKFIREGITSTKSSHVQKALQTNEILKSGQDNVTGPQPSGDPLESSKENMFTAVFPLPGDDKTDGAGGGNKAAGDQHMDRDM